MINKHAIRRSLFYGRSAQEPLRVLRAKFRKTTAKNEGKPWTKAGDASLKNGHYFPITLRDGKALPRVNDRNICSQQDFNDSFSVGKVPPDGNCLFECLRPLFATQTRPRSAKLPSVTELRTAISEIITRLAVEVSRHRANPRIHALQHTKSVA